MLTRLLALLALAYAAEPPPPVATLAITHPPDMSLVLNPVAVDVAVDLSAALAYDPSLDVASLQLCVSLDADAFTQCWPLLSAAGLPVFDFFAPDQRSDAATGARQHTLKAWLAFDGLDGLVVASARADFAAWALEAHPTIAAAPALRPDRPADLASLLGGNYSAGGGRLVVRVGGAQTEVVADIAQPFSEYLLAAERAVNHSLWSAEPEEAPLAAAEDRTLPLRPPFRAVELPFVRSGVAPGRTFCRLGADLGGERSHCEAFALVEAMLKVLAARPLCAVPTSKRTTSSSLGPELSNVDVATNAEPPPPRRARLLVLGSSSAWVWCGGAESEVVAVHAGAPQAEGAPADLGAGSLWCRGKPTTSGSGGSGVDVRVVPGASASGLNNPHSATGALNEFRKVLRGDFTATTPAGGEDAASSSAAAAPFLYDAVVLMVGEVDRSSTMWLKAARTLRAAALAAASGTASAAGAAPAANATAAAKAWPGSSAFVEAAKLEAAEAAARLVAFAWRDAASAAVLAPAGRVVVVAAPLPTWTRRQMLRLAYPHLLPGELQREADALAGVVSRSGGEAAAAVEVGASTGAASAAEHAAAGTPEELAAPAERTVADETAVTRALNEHLRRACAAATDNAPADASAKVACRFADATRDWLDAATGQGHGFFRAAQPDVHAHLERSFFFWKRALVAAGAAEWCSATD